MSVVELLALEDDEIGSPGLLDQTPSETRLPSATPPSRPANGQSA
ncbi:hypothetical protein ACVWWK_003280 [Bradyrhizobium sp. LB9.1b]